MRLLDWERAWHGWLAVAFAMSMMGLAGCEAEECSQMRACCGEVEDYEGVGKACGELISGLDDPGSCLSVTHSVVAMLEDQNDEIPAVCRLDNKAESHDDE
jgi:hypothetical protein